jgi:hypothetical protein
MKRRREEAAARERLQKEPAMITFFARKRTQAEIDEIKRAWNAQGVSRERQTELACSI